jgi:hypothetical protein
MAITVVKEVVSGAETVDVLLENEVLVKEEETNNVEDGITNKLSKEEKNDKEAFENLLKQAGKSKAQFIFDCILVGIALVGLKKKHLDRFYNVVDKNKISTTQVGRRMKLVLKSSVVYDECMNNNGTKKELEQRVSNLIIAPRVELLTVEILENIYKLTLDKAENMRFLSDKDWDIVLSGNSDEPYRKLVEKQNADKAAENKKNANAEKDKHIPNGMDKDDFYNQLSKGIYGVVSLLHTANTLNNGFEVKVNDLEAKNKSLSNELLVAQTKLEMYEKMPEKEAQPDIVVKADLPSEMPDSFTKQSEKKAS